MKKISMTATAIKVIAIIAMTIDHSALTFVPSGSALYYVMRCIGRITAPLMCFFLAEGFRHTHSKKDYLCRLCIFSIISQPFYFPLIIQRLPYSAFDFLTHQNVLVTLALSFAILCLIDSQKKSKPTTIVLIALLFSLTQFCDWSYMIPIWTLLFYYGSEKKWLPFAYVGTCVLVLPLVFIWDYDSLLSFSYQFGSVLALIPLQLYNGQRGGTNTKLKKKMSRWFFYVYYPAHMTVLLALTYLIGYDIIH